MPRRSRTATMSGPRWRTAPGLDGTAIDADADAAAHGGLPTGRPPGELAGELHGAEDDGAAARGGDPGASPSPVDVERTVGPDPATASPALSAPADGAEPAAPQVRLDGALRGLRRDLTRSEPSTGENRMTRDVLFTRSIRSLEPVSDSEAAAFAGRFAADFQSFDEDDPTRRAQVLRLLFADPRSSTWGWSGEGRQRADSPLPGRIFRTSDTVVFVEVFVRATPYARTRPQPAPGPTAVHDHVEPVGRVAPSSAPPESAARWVATAANWLRMTVPVTRALDDGRLVVDPQLVPDQST